MPALNSLTEAQWQRFLHIVRERAERDAGAAYGDGPVAPLEALCELVWAAEAGKQPPADAVRAAVRAMDAWFDAGGTKRLSDVFREPAQNGKHHPAKSLARLERYREPMLHMAMLMEAGVPRGEAARQAGEWSRWPADQVEKEWAEGRWSALRAVFKEAPQN